MKAFVKPAETVEARAELVKARKVKKAKKVAKKRRERPWWMDPDEPLPEYVSKVDDRNAAYLQAKESQACLYGPELRNHLPE